MEYHCFSLTALAERGLSARASIASMITPSVVQKLNHIRSATDVQNGELASPVHRRWDLRHRVDLKPLISPGLRALEFIDHTGAQGQLWCPLIFVLFVPLSLFLSLGRLNESGIELIEPPSGGSVGIRNVWSRLKLE